MSTLKFAGFSEFHIITVCMLQWKIVPHSTIYIDGRELFLNCFSESSGFVYNRQYCNEIYCSNIINWRNENEIFFVCSIKISFS